MTRDPTSAVLTSPKDGADRRERILDAAQARIVAGGLEGFRIREVAQRAGMHHASLLHYFPNREALIRGVVARIVATLERVPASEHAASTVALPPREALRAHFQHVLNQIRAYPERFVVLNELAVRARRDADSAQVLAEIDTSWRGYLVPLLERGRAERVFRTDLNPEAAALVITSCFKGLSEDPQLTPELRQSTITQLEHWIIAAS